MNAIKYRSGLQPRFLGGIFVKSNRVQESPVEPSVIHDVKPGQHTGVLTHSAGAGTPTSHQHRLDKLAGTIVSVDENVLVLNNAVRVVENRVMKSHPTFRNVPVLKGLFKCGSADVETVRIPAEVSIDCSEIVRVDDLTSEDLEDLHKQANLTRNDADSEVNPDAQ